VEGFYKGTGEMKMDNFKFNPNLKMHKIALGVIYESKNGNEKREVINIQPQSTWGWQGNVPASGPVNHECDLIEYRVVEGRANRLNKTGKMFRDEFSRWMK
jgi:hypothetical protein